MSNASGAEINELLGHHLVDVSGRDLGFDVLVGSMATHRFVMDIEDKIGNGFSSWRNDHVERRRGSAIEGRGLFVARDFERGEVLAIKGGRVVDEMGVRILTDNGYLHGSQQQIGPNEFLVGLTEDEEDDNLVGYNHSCEPNANVFIPGGSLVAYLMARRDIKEGEEVTTDYSVTSISNTHRLFCQCGAPSCRKIIQPRYDYLSSDFQERYRGEFPGYIQSLIAGLRELPTERRDAVLGSSGLARMAGGITLLASEVDRRLREPSLADLKRAIQSKQLPQAAIKELEELNVAIAYGSKQLSSAYAHLFGADELRKEGIDSRVLDGGPDTLMEQMPNIIRFAKRLDDQYGWYN